mmetsp:Transcript_15409/g.13141  ORF Transcript_15409/g.13141 Transcript_15409/m.13141 type:complete len:188 (-) Transcript_15409:930-1493(-)
MPDDIVVASGQQVNDIYFILDGEFDVIDLTTSVMPRLQSGSYFGGIIPNITQLHDVKCTKVCKVAKIRGDQVEEMRDAYPQWAFGLIKYEKVYKVVKKFKDALLKNVEEKRAKRWQEFKERYAVKLNPIGVPDAENADNKINSFHSGAVIEETEREEEDKGDNGSEKEEQSKQPNPLDKKRPKHLKI